MLNILWYIETANINIQRKFNVFKVICFRVTPKSKTNFVKNQFWVNIPVFLNF